MVTGDPPREASLDGEGLWRCEGDELVLAGPGAAAATPPISATVVTAEKTRLVLRIAGKLVVFSAYGGEVDWVHERLRDK